LYFLLILLFLKVCVLSPKNTLIDHNTPPGCSILPVFAEIIFITLRIGDCVFLSTSIYFELTFIIVILKDLKKARPGKARLLLIVPFKKSCYILITIAAPSFAKADETIVVGE